MRREQCVSCQDCEYVGETGCKLHTRLTEHKWHFSNLTAQLLLITMDHRIDFSEAPCWLQKTTSYGEERLRYFTSTNRTTSTNCSLESIRKTHLICMHQYKPNIVCTHLSNAVLLVWGLLRLIPIIHTGDIIKSSPHNQVQSGIHS